MINFPPNSSLFYELCLKKKTHRAAQELEKPAQPKLLHSTLRSIFLPNNSSSPIADFLQFQLLFLVTLGVGPVIALVSEEKRLQKSQKIADLIEQMGISDTNGKTIANDLYHLSISDVVFIKFLTSWAFDSLPHDQEKIIESTQNDQEAMLLAIDDNRCVVAKQGAVCLRDKKQLQLTRLLSFSQLFNLCRIPLNALEKPAIDILRAETSEHAQKEAAQLFDGIIDDQTVLHELMIMFIIYADFKLTLGGKDVSQDSALQLDECTAYLKINQDKLTALKNIFIEDGDGEAKLERYSDMCYIPAQNMHSQNPVKSTQLSSFYSAMCNLYEATNRASQEAAAY